jgi:hypothetical protein
METRKNFRRRPIAADCLIAVLFGRLVSMPTEEIFPGSLKMTTVVSSLELYSDFKAEHGSDLAARRVGK